MNAVARALTRTLLKIFLRDRQALFFSLFFPLIFMAVFGFITEGEPEPVRVGVVVQAEDALAAGFVESLGANPLFEVDTGTEDTLRRRLVEGDLTLVIHVPSDMGAGR